MANANEVKDVKKEEEKVEQVKPYQVFGSDFAVTQPAFITFYKYRMKTMAMKYKLVGKVDENGRYIIPDPIKRDLVKMEKEIEDQGEEYYKAIALYMKKHFYYTIKIKKQDDGSAKASLFLAEFVDNFLGHEYIVTHVADFVDEYNDEFRVKVRKAFHLVDVNVKVDDFAVPELAVVMQDAFDFELITGALYDTASQIFLMSMLQELESAGGLGQELLAKYRMLLAESDIEINEKFRYTSYKALLDRLIDEYGGYEKLGLDPVKVQKIVMDMNQTLMQIDKASMRGPMEMEAHQKSEKQKVLSAGKKSAAKKTASKSNSSKTDKKKTAKKEEKAKGPGVSLDEPQSSSGGAKDFVKDMVEITSGAMFGGVLSNVIEVVGDIIEQALGLGDLGKEDLDAGSNHNYNDKDNNENDNENDDIESALMEGNFGKLNINATEGEFVTPLEARYDTEYINNESIREEEASI